MGMLFFTSTLALGGSLWWLDRASGELSILSIVMCVPVALGVWVGMRVRGVLSEDQFKQIFLSAFTVLGAYLAVFGG